MRADRSKRARDRLGSLLPHLPLSHNFLPFLDFSLFTRLNRVGSMNNIVVKYDKI